MKKVFFILPPVIAVASMSVIQLTSCKKVSETKNSFGKEDNYGSGWLVPTNFFYSTNNGKNKFPVSPEDSTMLITSNFKELTIFFSHNQIDSLLPRFKIYLKAYHTSEDATNKTNFVQGANFVNDDQTHSHCSIKKEDVIQKFQEWNNEIIIKLFSTYV